MDSLHIVYTNTSFTEMNYRYRPEVENADREKAGDLKIDFSSIVVTPQKHLRDGTLFQLVMESDCSIASPFFELTCHPMVTLEFKVETEERYRLAEYLDKHEEEIRGVFQSEVEEALVQFFKLTPTQTNKNYSRNA